MVLRRSLWCYDVLCGITFSVVLTTLSVVLRSLWCYDVVCGVMTFSVELRRSVWCYDVLCGVTCDPGFTGRCEKSVP